MTKSKDRSRLWNLEVFDRCQGKVKHLVTFRKLYPHVEDREKIHGIFPLLHNLELLPTHWYSHSQDRANRNIVSTKEPRKNDIFTRVALGLKTRLIFKHIGHLWYYAGYISEPVLTKGSKKWTGLSGTIWKPLNNIEKRELLKWKFFLTPRNLIRSRKQVTL